MSKANDENNFVKAYGENEVSFQNFDENTDPQDQLQNSAFSLIRQIAKEQDEKEHPESLLGNGDGLKDHDSVMSLIKGQHSTPVNFKQDPINIAHIAKPLKNRSSLISFLREDNDDVGFAARAPIDYPKDNYSFNNQNRALKTVAIQRNILTNTQKFTIIQIILKILNLKVDFLLYLSQIMKHLQPMKILYKLFIRDY